MGITVNIGNNAVPLAYVIPPGKQGHLYGGELYLATNKVGWERKGKPNRPIYKNTCPEIMGSGL